MKKNKMLRDKLMEALRCKTETPIDRPDCGSCPYNNTLICNTQQIFADMLTLLEAVKLDEFNNANVAVKPIKGWFLNNLNIPQEHWFCGKCDEELVGRGKYCANCGQAVKWGTVLTGNVEEVNPELAKKGNENDPL